MATGDRRDRWAVWGVVVLAVLTVLPRLRLALATPGVVEADESIVFLMALHVAEGSRWSVFHYGNAYLGSFDATLAGLLMRLTEVSVLVGRSLAMGLAVVFTLTTVQLGRAVGGAAVGWRAGLYVALGPSLLVLWGTRLHLGYMDILILGNLLFMACLAHLRAHRRPEPGGPPSWWAAVAVGFLIGFGIWCHLLFVVYVLAACLVMVTASLRLSGRWTGLLPLRILALMAVGAVLGASPLLVFNAVHGSGTLDLVPAITGVGQALVDRLGVGGYNLVTLTPLVLGAAPPWELFRIEMAAHVPAPVAIVAQSLVLLGVAALWWVAAARWRRQSRVPVLATRGVATLGSILVATLACVTLGLVVARTRWRELLFDPHWYEADLPLGLIRDELLSPRFLVLLLYLVPVLVCIRRRRGAPQGIDRWGVGLLTVHLAVLTTCFVVSSYGSVRSPRFLLPAHTSIPVMVGLGAVLLDRWRRYAGAGWLAVVLAVQLAVQLAAPPALALQPAHYAGRLPVPGTYEPLARQLEALGLEHVYASYWTGFPLVFASRGSIRVADAGRGRLPELDRAVAGSDRVAFVFFRGRMDERSFARLLDGAGVEYRVADSGPFRIYTEVPVAELRKSPAWSRVVKLLSLP
jgi:hypothetical protein